MSNLSERSGSVMWSNSMCIYDSARLALPDTSRWMSACRGVDVYL
ncbi:hypothetical protein [Amycolatopsis sp. YIM 10]|nr:hypothetical protein [Amycolatopsis sp. YIM 10]